MDSKILVVDDNTIFRRLSVGTLKSAGYHVLEAASTLEALEVVKNSLPDLILTDVLMPGLDGFEFLRRLRQFSEFDRIKVVFYSATFFDQAEFKFAKDMGVISHLQKPLSATELCRAVEMALKQNSPKVQHFGADFDQEHLRLVTNKLSKKVEELEKANDEIIQAKNFFKSLADSIPQLAWQASKEGFLIYTNERWKHYHQIYSEKVSILQWADLVHPDDRPIFLEKIFTAFRQSENISFEAQLWNPELRGYFTHLISAKVVQRSIEKDANWFGTCTDISMQKDYEAKLVLLKDQAEKLSRAKTEFLNNISHELRTPLNAILGFCEVLQVEALENQIRFLDRIKEGALRLNSILDDVISISEIEADGAIVAPSFFSLSEFLNEVEKKYQPRAQNKGLELYVKNETKRSESPRGNPDIFLRILSHLLDNSIKFTSKGKVQLTVYETFGNDSAKRLNFEIEDTGIGIEAPVQNILFKPFTQADSSSTRKHGGLGLGLLMSKKLAHSIGAELVLVSSHPMQGSCFRLSWQEAPPNETKNSFASDEERTL